MVAEVIYWGAAIVGRILLLRPAMRPFCGSREGAPAGAQEFAARNRSPAAGIAPSCCKSPN